MALSPHQKFLDFLNIQAEQDARTCAEFTRWLSAVKQLYATMRDWLSPCGSYVLLDQPEPAGNPRDCPAFHAQFRRTLPQGKVEVNLQVVPDNNHMADLTSRRLLAFCTTKYQGQGRPWVLELGSNERWYVREPTGDGPAAEMSAGYFYDMLRRMLSTANVERPQS